MKSELHLFIIWSKGRSYEKKILESLSKNFEIVETIEMTWSKDSFVKSLGRFYECNFYPDLIDVIHRGNAPFILVTLLDHNPIYGIEMTSSGHSFVNQKMLRLKNRYREWIGCNYAVHSTVTVKETKHDLVYLLGKNYKDYLNDLRANKRQSQKMRQLSLNPKGLKKWDSIEEIFYTLNESISYTILRDFDASPNQLGEVSDIDILVDDFALETVPFILNGRFYPDPVPGTFMCDVVVQDKLIPFHFHSYAYLTPKWVHEILSTRILNKHSLFVPSLENQFFSLFYQLIHWKFVLKESHKNKLKELYSILFENIQKNNFDDYIFLLNKFICSKGYFSQNTSYLRQNPVEILAVIRENIEIFGITNIVPFRIDLWKAGKGTKLFTGVSSEKQKVFIKYFGNVEAAQREYKILNYLYKLDRINVTKPLFYRLMRAEHQLIITEYVDALPLSYKEPRLLSEAAKKSICSQVVDIVTVLHDVQFIHRDIGLSNLLLGENNEVYLIDYEYVVDKKNTVLTYNALDKNSLLSLYNLGVPNNIGVLKWNDAHSAIKILEHIEPKIQKVYPDLYNSLNNIKKNRSSTHSFKKLNLFFAKSIIKLKLSRFISMLSPFSKRILRKINN